MMDGGGWDPMQLTMEAVSSTSGSEDGESEMSKDPCIAWVGDWGGAESGSSSGSADTGSSFDSSFAYDGWAANDSSPWTMEGYGQFRMPSESSKTSNASDGDTPGPDSLSESGQPSSEPDEPSGSILVAAPPIHVAGGDGGVARPPKRERPAKKTATKKPRIASKSDGEGLEWTQVLQILHTAQSQTHLEQRPINLHEFREGQLFLERPRARRRPKGSDQWLNRYVHTPPCGIRHTYLTGRRKRGEGKEIRRKVGIAVDVCILQGVDAGALNSGGIKGSKEHWFDDRCAAHQRTA
jgi:hypothetical protein